MAIGFMIGLHLTRPETPLFKMNKSNGDIKEIFTYSKLSLKKENKLGDS